MPTAQTTPRPPSLADALAQFSKLGLTAVFSAFDQQLRQYADQMEMARKIPGDALPIPTGPLLTLDQRSVRQSTKGALPNGGWSLYDYVSRVGDSSVVYRPSSTSIGILPTEFKVDWVELGMVGAWFPGGVAGGFHWETYAAHDNNVLAPRTFTIRFNEKPTKEGYRANGRLGCNVVLIPGDKLTAGGKTFEAVTEAVRTVIRRVEPGVYVAWLESAETVNPTPPDKLHVGAIFVEAL